MAEALRKLRRLRSVLPHLCLLAISVATWFLLDPFAKRPDPQKENLRWFLGMGIAVLCLVFHMGILLLEHGLVRAGLREWLLREALSPRSRDKEKSRGVEWSEIVEMFIGSLLLLVVWLYFRVFIVLFLCATLLFSTLRIWLKSVLLSDPFYAWKRLFLLPLDRLAEVYWHTAFLFITFTSLLNVLTGLTSEALWRGALPLKASVPEFIARYGSIYGSPLPVLLPLPDRGIPSLEEHILAVRAVMEPDTGLLILFCLFLAALLFWLVRLVLSEPSWRREAQSLLGSPIPFGEPPPFLHPHTTAEGQRTLKVLVGATFVYTLAVCWFGLFLASNILLFLVSGHGFPHDRVVVPLAWMEALIADNLPGGGRLADGVLAFMALCLLLPPVGFLFSLGGNAFATLGRVRRGQKVGPKMREVVQSVVEGGGKGITLIYSPHFPAPVSYRFLGKRIVEWPWPDLPPVHSGDLALAISRFYLAHEVHHLEKHWKGVALLQLLSSLTLVSRNFLTLSLDLAQYERDADREAVKKSGGAAIAPI